LRDGARQLRERGLDAACSWVCLLFVVTLAAPAALAAWASPSAMPTTRAIHPIALLIPPLVVYACMLAMAYACAWRCQGGITAVFGLAPPIRWRGAVRDGVRFGLALVPITLILSMAMQQIWSWMGLDPTPQDAFGWLTDNACPVWSRVGLVILATVVAPVAEEAVFRGVLLASLLPRTGIAVALLLQGGLFGAAHAHGPSFIPLLVAGFGFGAGYMASGSLITPIVMHVVFNAASLALFFTFGQT
jgi:membrane protease YdiL (CAAX protease family)